MGRGLDKMRMRVTVLSYPPASPMAWTISLYTYTQNARDERELKEKEWRLVYFEIIFFRGHEVHLRLCGLDTIFDKCAHYLTTDCAKVVVSQTGTIIQNVL